MASTEVEIRLVDQVGQSLSGKEIIQDQWIVFADDIQIGYLGKAEGSWLQSIVSMDEETKRTIEASINEQIATAIGGVALPPKDDDEDEDE